MSELQTESVLRQVLARLRSGASTAEALTAVEEHSPGFREALRDGAAAKKLMLQEPQWRRLLVLFRMTRSSGVSAAPLIHSMITQLALQRKRQQQLGTLSVAGKATVVIICLLPLVLVFGAEASGISALSIIFEHTLVQLITLFGLFLLAMSAVWLNRILQTASIEPPDEAWYLELIAAGLTAGLSGSRAVAAVEAAYQWIQVADSPASQAQQELLRGLHRESRRSGIALVPLIEAEVEQLRTAQHSTFERKLNLVPIKILLPIGLLGLPGFIAIGVLPIVFAMLVSTTVF